MKKKSQNKKKEISILQKKDEEFEEIGNLPFTFKINPKILYFSPQILFLSIFMLLLLGFAGVFPIFSNLTQYISLNHTKK